MLIRKGGLTCLLLTCLLASCTSTTPEEQQRFKTLGVLDLTVGDAAGVKPQSFTLASIQLKVLGSTSHDANGYRYITSTYQIRNASSTGTPSPTPRTNVTFLAVDTTSTLSDTAVRTMKKADGTAANPALATQVLPSGNFAGDGSFSSSQSMQVFDASETSSLSGLPSSIQTVLPYGFVVDRTGGGRTLDANPASNDYQGTVSLSVKVPLQTPIENTPKSVTLTMIYVEDSINQVTESLEEKQLGSSGLAARVAAAGASRVNVFPGSAYTGTSRTLCSVPISGGATPAYLINQTQKPQIWPTFSAQGTLPVPTTPVLASYCDDQAGPVLSGSTPQNQLVIQALQTGKRLSAFNSFNAGTFSQTGGQWRYTPTVGAPFKPGEEVEVTAVGGSAALSATQRFRITGAAEGATGFNAPTTITTGDTPWSVALGDLNGDGRLDMIHPHYGGSRWASGWAMEMGLFRLPPM
ncbi:FG-GAP repeat domain-containing protein [Deinococcus cellulosilyticus]|uniref:Uncharacterized protein n=1 Tax=Deinococcus cellulosilyticus (strain DSM 18568 / NBRC 106333 / KACC 11606 / 5516J-15) TaxID=1223518 RepID=A0A511MVS2_DEIC1|nr:VCBS repeat-containing protein [Deinococcus cellulosilyticus]GEM44683.1 hypothetical protein DC3_03180 [Deinococcus cellulosilyticus NBRC 106333 = KACC 11606]